MIHTLSGVLKYVTSNNGEELSPQDTQIVDTFTNLANTVSKLMSFTIICDKKCHKGNALKMLSIFLYEFMNENWESSTVDEMNAIKLAYMHVNNVWRSRCGGSNWDSISGSRHAKDLKWIDERIRILKLQYMPTATSSAVVTTSSPAEEASPAPKASSAAVTLSLPAVSPKLAGAWVSGSPSVSQDAKTKPPSPGNKWITVTRKGKKKKEDTEDKEVKEDKEDKEVKEVKEDKEVKKVKEDKEVKKVKEDKEVKEVKEQTNPYKIAYNNGKIELSIAKSATPEQRVIAFSMAKEMANRLGGEDSFSVVGQW